MKQKLAEIFNLIFGFRKMILMLIIFVVGIVFRIHGLINGAEMVDLFKTTAIAFMSANGVEHVVSTINAYVGSKAATKQVADTDESNDNKDATPAVEG